LKFCVSEAGDVTCAEPCRRTGFDAAEARHLEAMGDWKFKPYLVAGKPVPVCSVKAFSHVND
jgi:hypothetical protein